MNSGAIIGAFTLLLGVATVSVLVSQKAQTGSVISAITGGIAKDIGAAVAPVTGGGSNVMQLQ